MPVTPTRKLAAIMFTDMVGYTAMMQEDETLAKSIRDRHRQVLKKTVRLHNGTILQYFGDGTLTIFDSSIEAVSAAAEIQTVFLQEPKIPLRIGIHSGDIVYDSEGVYGDGVNIAARIESLSKAGSVLLSEKVYDDLKNHPEYPVKSLGNFELKNVKKPMEVFALSKGALAIPSRQEIENKTVKNYKSIAVLPFVNMSADKENEYFSDGITEEILNALSRVEGMQVTSRTSSFAFKNKNIDMRAIGKQLNVKTILEGSVRKAGQRVRITAQLIDTENGYHLWSEVFDRQLYDIFEVQDEISRNIVGRLREKLSAKKVSDTLVKHKTHNIEAYNIYLKGLYHMNRFMPEDISTALGLFKKAIDLQPDFMLPYSYTGYCYGFMGATGYMKPKEAHQKSLEYAQKALELDKNHYINYFLLALSDLYFTNDLENAYKNFQKAFALNPGAAEVYQYYAIYLASIGNMNEAFESIERAVELDPLSSAINVWYGLMHMLLRRFDEAIVIFDKILERDPLFRGAREAKAWNLYFKGEINEAIENFEKYQEQTGSPLKGWTGLGFVYGDLGETGKAEEIIEKIKQRQKKEPDMALDLDLGIVYTGMKEYKKAITHLTKGLAERFGFSHLLVHPLFDKAKKDPYFSQFLRDLEEEENLNLSQ